MLLTLSTAFLRNLSELSLAKQKHIQIRLEISALLEDGISYRKNGLICVAVGMCHLHSHCFNSDKLNRSAAFFFFRNLFSNID